MMKSDSFVTLQGSKIAPARKPSQKEMSSSSHPFSGVMLVSGRVTNMIHWCVGLVL